MLALSMLDDEQTIVRMLKLGVKGYLLKDTHPHKLQAAMNALISKGFYYTDLVTGRLVHSLKNDDEKQSVSHLSANEIKFRYFAAQNCLTKKLLIK